MTVHIWPPDTGIKDIEGDWRALRASDMPGIARVWRMQQERLKGTPRLTTFIERMHREWAIETGIIEGLYDIDRGVTQTLIEHGFREELLSHGSTDQPRDYVIGLLRDQHDALEGLFDFVSQSRTLTTSYIKELHAAMTRRQTHTEGRDSFGRIVEVPLLRGEWKTQRNSPTRDGEVFEYCPPEQTASEMDRLVGIYGAQVEAGVGHALAQQARGPEGQHEDERDEGEDVGVVAAQHAAGEITQVARADGLDQAQQDGAHHRAGKVADAAQHSGREQIGRAHV